MYFTALPEGEDPAGRHLRGFVAASGVDGARASAYHPCRAARPIPGMSPTRPSIHAEPADAVLAPAGNFSAWGGYGDTTAKALRTHPLRRRRRDLRLLRLLRRANPAPRTRRRPFRRPWTWARWTSTLRGGTRTRSGRKGCCGPLGDHTCRRRPVPANGPAGRTPSHHHRPLPAMAHRRCCGRCTPRRSGRRASPVRWSA